MAESAFDFLLTNDGKPYFPSKCYIVADPKISDPKKWTLQFEEPVAHEWVYQLDDIKDWMLHDSKPTRQIIYDRKDPRTPYRNLERDEVFREYLRKLMDSLPAEYQSRRKHALMPSIADERRRIRYKEAVEAAIPGVTIVPEPEMVAEYFRLVKRSLRLEAGKNNVILVVDVGASTANMTLIVSRRDATIMEVDATGAQRDLRLRALRGDSVGHAGRWVDLKLAEILEIPATDLALREIEKAKVKASSSGDRVEIDISSKDRRRSIDRRMLFAISSELWNELKPLFSTLCDRLYENQMSTKDAKQKSRDRHRELGISGPDQAYRLIDTILLAGGTSLLPGFQESMLATLFPDEHRPQVLLVGDSYPLAAAAGGLAHILHNYDPPRLREVGTSEEGVYFTPLKSTLSYPLLLGIKQSSEREEQITVLDPNDPFADDGGRRQIDTVLPLPRGSQPKTRLIPGPGAGVVARQGRPFKAMTVRTSPVRMELEWDPVGERAAIYSNDIDDTGHLWIDAEILRKRHEPALDPYVGQLPDGSLAVDAADDVILDLGMSKIVAMAARRGTISADDMERAVRDGIVHSSTEGSSSDYVVASSITGTPVRGYTAPEKEDTVSQADPLREASIAARNLSETIPVEPLKPARPDRTRSLRAAAVEPRRSDPSPATGVTWTNHLPDTDFSQALVSLKEATLARSPHFVFDDLAVALLALSVRPVVLLAGPPGCGKSTLARFMARVLGLQAGSTFHEVAVQAHWETDAALFGSEGPLRPLIADTPQSHLVLFDEFNLTRPEYYMSRIFNALDGGRGMFEGGKNLAACRVVATLNIDESSRPPSPKVIDRCFLLELEQVAWNGEISRHPQFFDDLTPLKGLPIATGGGANSDEKIDVLLQALQAAVSNHDLRHDLLPSRRVLEDVRAILGLHNRLDLQAKGLLDRDQLVDRVISSRILVKLHGAFEQLQPALTALEQALDWTDLPRSRRRLKLARQQARLGFISPWQ